MHFVDGLALSFLGIMIGLGGFRGHRKEILSIIAVIGAILAVLAFHEAATTWLSGWAPSHWNLRFLSIYLIFIVSYVVSALVARLFLPRPMGQAGVSLNRWLGAILGFWKGLIILVAKLALLPAALTNSKGILHNAQFYRLFQPVTNILGQSLSKDFSYFGNKKKRGKEQYVDLENRLQ